MYPYPQAKRAFDLIVAAVALIILAPLMLAVVLLIAIDSPGPIFYRGQRATKDKYVFYLFKFRSMVVDAEQKGGFSTALNDPRFTGVGRFLRRYKLDELPQLLNIILGDMSFVGPRPQVLYYTQQYNTDQQAMLSVKPGLTDLASLYFLDMDAILGEGDVDKKYQQEIEPLKNQLRMRYVKNRTFILDMKIIVATLLCLIGIRYTFDLPLDVD